jgi:hypothetical protein
VAGEKASIAATSKLRMNTNSFINDSSPCVRDTVPSPERSRVAVQPTDDV